MDYIIQENVFREQHYNILFDALEKLQLKHTTVRVFPYVDKIVKLEDIPNLEGNYNVDELPDFRHISNNIFVFGSLKLARIGRDLNWKPGSLMNNNHDFLIYSKYYKDNLLNYDSEIRKLKDDLNWRPEEIKFIRPTQDTKAFTGAIFTERDWKEKIENYLHNFRSAHFNEETEIQVTVPKNIYKEIRCWVVDGKIITASLYRLGSQVIYDNFVEDEALQFAQSMVDIFQLADAFVIDVCLTDKGWKIVECGCINCAGFYKADLQKVIIALENKYA